MRNSTGPTRLLLAVTTIAALISGGALTQASSAWAADADTGGAGVTVLSAGNIAIAPKITNATDTRDVASFQLGLLQKTNGYANATWYAPSDAVLHVGADDFHADTNTWSTPSTVDDAAAYGASRLLLGLDLGTATDAAGVQGPNGNAPIRVSPQRTSPVFTLVSTTAPEGGRVQAAPAGATASAWDSGAATQTPIFAATGDSANYTGWSFTAAGKYCVTVSNTLKSYTSKADLTEQATYTIYVGDLPAHPTACGDDSDNDGGSGDDGPGDGSGDGDTAPVLSHGNIALTPKITNATDTRDIASFQLGLLDKTGGYANEKWYAPDEAILHLGDADYDSTAKTWSTPSTVDDPDAYTTGDPARLLLGLDLGSATDAAGNPSINPGAPIRVPPQRTSPVFTLVSATAPNGGALQVSAPGASAPAWDSTSATQTPIFVTTGDAGNYIGWSFTTAGKYCVTVSNTLKSYSSKTDLTEQATYTVYVGDLPSKPTTCDNPGEGPGDGGDDPGDGGDGPGDGGGVDKDPVTLLSSGHMDVRTWLNSAGDGLVVGGNQNTDVPSKDLVLAGTRDSSVPVQGSGSGEDQLFTGQDLTFIGKPGTPFSFFPQGGAPQGFLWPGFASDFTNGQLAESSQVSLTLDGVSGPSGGDVWLWTQGTGGAYNVQYSSVWGLPHTWSNGTAFHSHNYWAFTQPGRYCLNFASTAQKADGSYVHGAGQITIWAGDPAQASSVIPCDRDTTPAVASLPPLSIQRDKNGYVSADEYSRIDPYLTTDGKLDVAVHSQKGITDPATDRDLNDVILSTRWYVNGQGWRTGDIPNGGGMLQTDSDRVPWASVEGPIDWRLGDVKGPGTVTMVQENGVAKFSTAEATKQLDYQLPPSSNSDSQAWMFSKPGVYCVPFTMSVTPKGATAPVTVDKTMTVVAGSADPASPDYVDRSTLTTCANGQKPTAAAGGDDGDGDGSGDDGVKDSDVFVPNESLTDSGAVILNNGHVDIASKVHGDTLETWVKDTTESSEPRYHPLTGSNSVGSGDRSATNNGNSTVFQLLPQSETKVPDDSTYSFLGAPQAPVWQVTQTQQTELGLLWPGWSTEEIPLDATKTGVQWSLDRTSGPGEFALYTADAAQLGKVDVLFNTRDGITAADSFQIAQNAHVHGTWAFSAQGTYCLAFSRSTTLANGSKASDDFTLAVAVGRVDVKKVDPGKCFTDAGKPATQDTTPVPESQLTSDTAGGVQVLNSEAGFYPGQQVTVQVGTPRAGQWVSVWLHSQPTWLGWAQVNDAGAVQVRLPVDAALGSHKIVVKTQAGELIGWDVLAVVKAPDDGSGGDGNDPGDGDGGSTNPVCTAGDTTIISSGHLDYTPRIVNGKIESYIGDNASGTEVFREPSKTVLWLKPSSLTTLQPGFEQIGAAGSQVFLGPQTQNPDLIWLGWSTQQLAAGSVTTPVTWDLTDVDGPGTLKVFLQGEFGGFGQMVFNGTGSHTIAQNSHVHANWAFSKAGIYRLHFTESATLANGQASSDSEVVTIVVGDVDPVTAVPGGKDCVGDDGGHTGDDGTGDGGNGGGAQQGNGGDTPANQAAAQCTSTGFTVLTFGHMDWNTQVIGGKLESLIGDDSTGTRLYRDPATTVLWLKPSSQESVPAGLSQVGPAGSTIWQIPQTQKSDLVWLGWSTELMNAGNASSPVTWSLTSVDGPGSVKVYTVGTFGGVQQMVFNGTGSTTIPLGSHVHANWAFSAQGVYHLHFTQSATLANGQRSSDSEVLTVAVGDVNPNTALAKGPGCGAISNAVLTGNKNLDAAKQAAEQAQADAARAQAGVLPGGSTGPSIVDPITALTQGNPVPLLLSILGALLLLGGAGMGVLWWRRRKWEGVTAQAPTGS